MSNLAEVITKIKNGAKDAFPESDFINWLPELRSVTGAKRQLVYNPEENIFLDATFTFSINLPLILGRRLKLAPKIVAKNIIEHTRLDCLYEKYGFIFLELSGLRDFQLTEKNCFQDKLYKIVVPNPWQTREGLVSLSWLKVLSYGFFQNTCLKSSGFNARLFVNDSELQEITAEVLLNYAKNQNKITLNSFENEKSDIITTWVPDEYFPRKDFLRFFNETQRTNITIIDVSAALLNGFPGGDFIDLKTWSNEAICDLLYGFHIQGIPRDVDPEIYLTKQKDNFGWWIRKCGKSVIPIFSYQELQFGLFPSTKGFVFPI